jgi:hypothetical protein
MTTTTTNVDLLRNALDAIEADPTHWDGFGWATRDQGAGNLYSLAARVCILAGHAINWDRVNEWSNATFLTNGNAIPETAAALLGLGTLDAHALFDIDLNIARTRKVGDRLIRRATRGKASR